jgi:LemA protein
MSASSWLNKKLIAGIIIIVVILSVFLWIGLTYNNFVRLDQNIDAQWNEIKNQDRRKMDLIPTLVNLTEGYQQFEKSTLENVTRLRSQWLIAGSDQEKANISVQMSGYLSGLRFTYEAYPELQAVAPLRDTMDEIAGTENRITYARTLYIDYVREYNTAIKVLPSAIIAGMFGFDEKENLFSSAPSM